MPSLEEWRNLSSDEKAHVLANRSIQEEQLREILQFIDREFRKKVSGIEGITILGVGDRFGELAIAVKTPFVFDTSRLPKKFESLPVHRMLSDVPAGFDRFKGYFWAPENWEDFVDENFDAIRSKLANHEMSKDDVYRALIGMPLNEWIEMCRRKGLTERYAAK
jgi:hypothetical protein